MWKVSGLKFAHIENKNGNIKILSFFFKTMFDSRKFIAFNCEPHLYKSNKMISIFYTFKVFACGKVFV